MAGRLRLAAAVFLAFLDLSGGTNAAIPALPKSATVESGVAIPSFGAAATLAPIATSPTTAAPTATIPGTLAPTPAPITTVPATPAPTPAPTVPATKAPAPAPTLPATIPSTPAPIVPGNHAPTVAPIVATAAAPYGSCQAFMEHTGCGWTKDYNCPGQSGGAHKAATDTSHGFYCCCKMGLWKAAGKLAVAVKPTPAAIAKPTPAATAKPIPAATAKPTPAATAQPTSASPVQPQVIQATLPPNAPVHTMLQKAVKAGATVLSVKSNVGFHVGERVVLDAGPLQETNFIAGFGSIVLKFPLQYAHAADVSVLVVEAPTTQPPLATLPPTTKPPATTAAPVSIDDVLMGGAGIAPVVAKPTEKPVFHLSPVVAKPTEKPGSDLLVSFGTGPKKAKKIKHRDDFDTFFNHPAVAPPANDWHRPRQQVRTPIQPSYSSTTFAPIMPDSTKQAAWLQAMPLATPAPAAMKKFVLPPLTEAPAPGGITRIVIPPPNVPGMKRVVIPPSTIAAKSAPAFKAKAAPLAKSAPVASGTDDEAADHLHRILLIVIVVALVLCCCLAVAFGIFMIAKRKRGSHRFDKVDDQERMYDLEEPSGPTDSQINASPYQNEDYSAGFSGGSASVLPQYPTTGAGSSPSAGFSGNLIPQPTRSFPLLQQGVAQAQTRAPATMAVPMAQTRAPLLQTPMPMVYARR